MCKKERKRIDGSKYSAYQVRDAANAYYALSCVLTDAMPDDKDGVERAGYKLATIGASATNRLLAIELYFKAMFIGRGVMFDGVHDLKKLYNALPQADRSVIQTSFDARRQIRNTVDVNWTVNVPYQLGENLELKRPTVDLSDESLEALLHRNRDRFVGSRYLFQDVKPDAPAVFTYEYRALGILCDILREFLDNGLRAD